MKHVPRRSVAFCLAVCLIGGLTGSVASSVSARPGPRTTATGGPRPYVGNAVAPIQEDSLATAFSRAPGSYEKAARRAIPRSLRQAVKRGLKSGRIPSVHPFVRTARGYSSAAGLRSRFTAAGIRLTPGGPATLNVRTTSFGRSSSRRLAAATPRLTANRLDFNHPHFTEWYRNGARGLEQGFTIAGLSGSRTMPAIITMRTSGKLRPVQTSRREVDFQWRGRSVIRYQGLRVWDAKGRAVPAAMRLRGRTISIVIHDRFAAYPITVDPFFLTQEFTGSDNAVSDIFGRSIAMSSDGSTAIVGAPGKNSGTGAAYIFTRSGSTYTQTDEFDGFDSVPYDNFGWSVAMSGDGTVAVVGAPGHLSGAGAVYVFVLSGGSYGQTAELTASDWDYTDYLGVSVAITSNAQRILAGAPNHCPFYYCSGGAYIFVKSGATYVQSGELVPNDGYDGDNFGNSVALSDDGVTAFVGSPWHAANGFAQAGTVYIYTRSGSIYSQTAKLTATDGVYPDLFGYSLSSSSDGTVLLVGAPLHASAGATGSGAAYTFTKIGSAFTQTAEMSASDVAAAAQFGYHVTLSRDATTAVVGANSATVSGNAHQGIAYGFTSSGAGFTQTDELTAFDGAGGDFLGEGIGLDSAGDLALISAGGHDAGSGSVYAFSQGSNLTTSSTAVALTQATNPSNYGDTLQFTATVGPSTSPTGSVSFFAVTPGQAGVDLGSSPIVGGQAVITSSGMHVGAGRVYAVYSGDSTYAGSQGHVNQTVKPAPLHVHANSISVFYGTAVPAFTYSVIGYVNGDDASSFTTLPSCVTAATINGAGLDTSPVGPYPITCGAGVAPDYTISYTAGTLTVKPVLLTITASSPTTSYGTSPAIQPIYSGLAPVDTAPKVPPTCTSTGTSHSGVGTYPTSCSGASDPNYTITYMPGSLTITTAPLVISASGQSLPYGAQVQLGWTANFVAGDTASALTSPPVCNTTALITNGRISSPAGQSYPVTCSGAASDNYNPITYNTGQLTVTLAHGQIKSTTPSAVTHGKPAVFSAALYVNGTTPIVGRKLHVALGTGSKTQRCITGPTTQLGRASCRIAKVNQSKGKVSLIFSFTGDLPGANYDYAPARLATKITIK